MSEELKIIISAVTSTAKKNIKEVKDELEKMGAEGSKASSKLKDAMGTVCTAIKGTTIAIAAISTALVTLGNSTKELQAELGKLNTAFMSSGSSAEQASIVYKNLFRFLGDSSKATEAAAHLAKLTISEEELAQWTTICQGIYATFGDSLPIEGLTEAANETARVGKVTGVMADALNWAGVNEDAFNVSLANTNSLSEREALIRNTLNNLYSDAAAIYERNNADLLALNEAQARLNITTSNVGKSVLPLNTAILNLSNAILSALAPAIRIVSNVLAFFINKIAQAVQWVSAFFGLLSGGKSVDNTVKIANNIGAVGSGVASAGNSAGTLEDGLTGANKAAEKLKRTTAGFDELNKVSAASTSSSGSGSSSGGAGEGTGVDNALGGFALDTSGLDGALGDSSAKVDGFVTKIKSAINTLKTVFAPTIEAWRNAFNSIDWETISENFSSGLESIKTAFNTLGGYVLQEFIPNIVNSFSVNLAPVLGDIFGLSLEEASLAFENLGKGIDEVVNTVIKPSLELVETIVTDVFDGVGKAWKKYGQPLLEQISKLIKGIKKTIEDLWKITIKPIIDNLISKATELWKKHLKPLWDNITQAVLEISTNLLELWNKILKPILDWVASKIYPKVKDVVNKVISIVAKVLSTVTNVVNGAITVLRGIINFITGVFTGNWRKAWTGVKQIFKGAFDALWAVAKVPLNLIIGAVNTVVKGIVGAVNTAIKAINKLNIKVPDWVPSIGGKSFGFNLKTLTAPQIPKLATGGIVTGSILANIGEKGKEAVLPLESNTEWMDILADKIASKNDTPSKIVLMLDGKELGWANIKTINNITKQTGKIQLLV